MAGRRPPRDNVLYAMLPKDEDAADFAYKNVLRPDDDGPVEASAPQLAAEGAAGPFTALSRLFPTSSEAAQGSVCPLWPDVAETLRLSCGLAEESVANMDRACVLLGVADESLGGDTLVPVTFQQWFNLAEWIRGLVSQAPSVELQALERRGIESVEDEIFRWLLSWATTVPFFFGTLLGSRVNQAMRSLPAAGFCVRLSREAGLLALVMNTFKKDGAAGASRVRLSVGAHGEPVLALRDRDGIKVRFYGTEALVKLAQHFSTNELANGGDVMKLGTCLVRFDSPHYTPNPAVEPEPPAPAVEPAAAAGAAATADGVAAAAAAAEALATVGIPAAAAAAAPAAAAAAAGGEGALPEPYWWRRLRIYRDDTPDRHSVEAQLAKMPAAPLPRIILRERDATSLALSSLTRISSSTGEPRFAHNLCEISPDKRQLSVATDVEPKLAWCTTIAALVARVRANNFAITALSDAQLAIIDLPAGPNADAQAVAGIAAATQAAAAAAAADDGDIVDPPHYVQADGTGGATLVGPAAAMAALTPPGAVAPAPVPVPSTAAAATTAAAAPGGGDGTAAAPAAGGGGSGDSTKPGNIDIRGVARGHCKECGEDECDQFVSLETGPLCGYCQCPPVKHVRL